MNLISVFDVGLINGNRLFSRQERKLIRRAHRRKMRNDPTWNCNCKPHCLQREPTIADPVLLNKPIEQISSCNDHINHPLRFWFCTNPGLAIPTAALAYGEQQITIKFASDEPISNSGG